MTLFYILIGAIILIIVLVTYIALIASSRESQIEQQKRKIDEVPDKLSQADKLNSKE